MYWIEYNNVKNTDFGVAVTTRPTIPAPEPRGDYVQIAGRDGELLITDHTYNNIVIDVALNFVRPPVKVAESYRKLKSWIKGGGTLRLGDDSEVFYKVKMAQIVSPSRRGKLGMDAVAEFVCDPYAYFYSGLVPIGAGVIYNPYDTSHPIYKITGEGLCTITVNDKTITANVGQNLTIDSDLFIAYRTDGTAMNTAVTGDYANLWLPYGRNNVSITSGFNLSIIPNWRAL